MSNQREAWEIDDAERCWTSAWAWIKAGDKTVRDVTIREIAHYHRKRNKLWHADSEPWTLADWSNAAAGEMGEVCNVVKKIRRLQTGMKGVQLRNQGTDVNALVDKAKGEIGGVFIYLLSLCDALQIDLTDAIRDEFNQVSSDQGFDVYIPAKPVEIVSPLRKVVEQLLSANAANALDLYERLDKALQEEDAQ